MRTGGKKREKQIVFSVNTAARLCSNNKADFLWK